MPRQHSPILVFQCYDNLQGETEVFRKQFASVTLYLPQIPSHANPGHIVEELAINGLSGGMALVMCHRSICLLPTSGFVFVLAIIRLTAYLCLVSRLRVLDKENVDLFEETTVLDNTINMLVIRREIKLLWPGDDIVISTFILVSFSVCSTLAQAFC
jgi:hypothetical protein